MNQNPFMKFVSKYHTPLVFKILITVLLLGIFVFLFLITTTSFSSENSIFLHAISDRYDIVRYSGNVFRLFRYNYSYDISVLFQVLSILSIVAGIVFIWLNRPVFATVPAAFLLTTTIFSSFNSYDYGGMMRDAYGWSSGDDYFIGGWKEHYFLYILYGLVIALIILIVLSIIITKKKKLDPVQAPNPINPVPTYTQPSPSNFAPMPPAAEQITQYKKLLDDGVITPEEFEQKKQQLLNL